MDQSFKLSSVILGKILLYHFTQPENVQSFPWERWPTICRIKWPWLACILIDWNRLRINFNLISTNNQLDYSLFQVIFNKTFSDNKLKMVWIEFGLDLVFLNIYIIFNLKLLWPISCEMVNLKFRRSVFFLHKKNIQKERKKVPQTE